MSVSVVMPDGETWGLSVPSAGLTGLDLKKLIVQRSTDHGVETCADHFALSSGGKPISNKDIVQAGQSVNANQRLNGGGCTCECRCTVL